MHPRSKMLMRWHPMIAAFVAALLIGGLGFCGSQAIAAPSCCPNGHAPDQSPPPCCVVQPAVDQKAPDLHGGFAPDLPAVSVTMAPIDFDRHALAFAQSRVGQAYVPDQSGRHLELRVLLN